MLKIGLVCIKKHGGFPFTGCVFQAIIFFKNDIDFISKIVNELDMSDITYRYALTFISKPYVDDKTMDKNTKYNERIKMINSLYKKLKANNLNKDMTLDGFYINLMNNEVYLRRKLYILIWIMF